jgi:hypothetical protein
MAEEEIQLQPNSGTVLQEEYPDDEYPEQYPLTTIDVCVVDVSVPVRVQQLPTKAGSTRTRTVGSSVPVQVLTADHYRASVLLCAFDQDLLYAFSEAAAQDPSTMSRQPKNIPLMVRCATDVWVMAQTSTTSLSITTERWATGG